MERGLKRGKLDINFFINASVQRVGISRPKLPVLQNVPEIGETHVQQSTTKKADDNDLCYRTTYC